MSLIIAIAKSPSSDINIKAHYCNFESGLQCSCSSLGKSKLVKYLGVLLDENLSWSPHIDMISCRTRKLIWTFKNLRHVANFETLQNVYYALAQSIISYCIGVWGGACKSYMIKLERAQRSLLKTMMFKPFRFPTKLLYEECKFLTVRQLYILHTVSWLHSHTNFDRNSYLNKRTIRHVNIPDTCRTVFAQRQRASLSAFLYNKLNKQLNFYPLSLHECKCKIRKWLLSLNYEQTEKLTEALV